MLHIDTCIDVPVSGNDADPTAAEAGDCEGTSHKMADEYAAVLGHRTRFQNAHLARSGPSASQSVVSCCATLYRTRQDLSCGPD